MNWNAGPLPEGWTPPTAPDQTHDLPSLPLVLSTTQLQNKSQIWTSDAVDQQL